MSRRLHIPLASAVLILACALAALLTGQSAPSEAAAKEGLLGKETTPSILCADSSSFIESGCNAQGRQLDCSGLGLEQRLGCSQISNISEALGGLSPRLPMAECLAPIEDENFEEGIVREGCLLPVYRRYIVKQDGEFRLIRTKAEFRSLYAPVQTPQEALSFAVALTNSFPRYDTSPPEDYFPVVASIEPSHAEEKDGAFSVHLFNRPICGCGSHPYYAVNYLVSKEGEVTELSRQMVYDSSFAICFD